MKIEFELTVKQEQALKDILSRPDAPKRTPNELAQMIFVNALIAVSQDLLAKGLRE